MAQRRSGAGNGDPGQDAGQGQGRHAAGERHYQHRSYIEQGIGKQHRPQAQLAGDRPNGRLRHAPGGVLCGDPDV
jgi:hypothetical protein